MDFKRMLEEDLRMVPMSLLRKLIRYNNIVVQCHNVPDADSICSGFALTKYLEAHGAKVRLVYGGAAKITKPNLLMLIEDLGIEIEHMANLPLETDLLVTVDCQHGAGNVHPYTLPVNTVVAIIDHHRPEIPEGENICIRPNLASCATLVWDLFVQEGFEMGRDVQTALYYGLFADTNGMSELRHPLDRDLSELHVDMGLVRKLKNAAITFEEIDIISKAFSARDVYMNIALFQAEPCDANLLGFTSDIAQQVVHVDCCVVYSEFQHGLKLSIRSSSREIMASEIAQFLCRDAGSGGGNFEKAGGFLTFKKIAEVSPLAPVEYLKSRIHIYLDSYDMIYAGKNNENFSAMKQYRKMPIPVGVVSSTDIFAPGTKITIRTLEGDVDTITHADMFLMVGILGEVYPIMKERFNNSYTISTDPYDRKFEYPPTIINRFTGSKHIITAHALTCVPKDSKLVRARELTKDTKVFTNWDTEKYFYGGAGDYLVANEDDFNDCYIVRGDIFLRTYQ